MNFFISSKYFSNTLHHLQLTKIPNNVAGMPTIKLDFSSSADMLDNSC